MKKAQTRRTVDVCSDCWYEINPGDYFPETDRFSQCKRCGWETLVARIPIEIIEQANGEVLSSYIGFEHLEK